MNQAGSDHPYLECVSKCTVGQVMITLFAISLAPLLSCQIKNQTAKC